MNSDGADIEVVVVVVGGGGAAAPTMRSGSRCDWLKLDIFVKYAVTGGGGGGGGGGRVSISGHCPSLWDHWTDGGGGGVIHGGPLRPRLNWRARRSVSTQPSSNSGRRRQLDGFWHLGGRGPRLSVYSAVWGPRMKCAGSLPHSTIILLDLRCRLTTWITQLIVFLELG